jgi:hypothetical protein
MLSRPSSHCLTLASPLNLVSFPHLDNKELIQCTKSTRCHCGGARHAVIVVTLHTPREGAGRLLLALIPSWLWCGYDGTDRHRGRRLPTFLAALAVDPGEDTATTRHESNPSAYPPPPR